MRINKLNIALLLGGVVITGILLLQFLLLRQAVQYEEKKFDRNAHIALSETVATLNKENKATLPQGDPVEKIRGDYYIANVNSKFEAASLDFYLKNNFDKFDLLTDFEYSIYDCHAEKMQYGNYISFTARNAPQRTAFAPTVNRGPYYFAVYFPQKSSYIYKNLKAWIVFAFVMLIALILYAYSVFTILQQKKFSELQKEFINNMTHEFKTPISSVLIASRYLAEQEAVQQDEKLNKYTGLIIDQTTKLNNHVEKILNLAKTGNDSLRMQKTETDLMLLIHAVTENILMKHAGTELKVSGPAECLISADSFHLTNLIYNLTDNSVKYSAGIPQVDINVTRQQNQFILSIKDKGCGIPAGETNKVFDKFYRVQRNGNGPAGFGLGLFYVSRICKEHKWNLVLKSAETLGTEVIISIPVHEKKI